MAYIKSSCRSVGNKDDMLCVFAIRGKVGIALVLAQLNGVTFLRVHIPLIGQKGCIDCELTFAGSNLTRS